MSPAFHDRTPPAIPGGIADLLPHQGSFELQQDQPEKVHNWHFHSLTEELFIIQGDALLFWDADGVYQERHCPSGTWITLPAGTVHGSRAGADGVVYMIRPEGGRTAETTFLESVAFPHPTPGPLGAPA